MRVAVLGLGRVGLTTAAILAAQRHWVSGVDTDARKVEALRQRQRIYDEPALFDTLESLHDQFGYPIYESVPLPDLASASSYDAIFVCVGTPPLANGASDLSQLSAVAETIAQVDFKGSVIIRSTVPVGTTRQFAQAAKLSSEQVAHFPEFLREGHAYEDACDRQPHIFGILSGQSAALDFLRAIYPSADTLHLRMAAESAELLKYATNAWLAMSVSFANVMAELAEKTGADYRDVEQVLRYDERIGEFAYIAAGPGYGGPCLPKDLASLIHQCRSNEVPPFLLSEVAWTNDYQIRRWLTRISRALGGNLAGKNIVINHRGFKPDCEDETEAPAVKLGQALADLGAVVTFGSHKGVENIAAYLKFDAKQQTPSILGEPYFLDFFGSLDGDVRLRAALGGLRYARAGLA